jgi:3'(2'), 5'-bisphosphate nucleotidase
MEEILKMAVHAALEAGKEILKVYESGDFEIDSKSDDSPLTKADRIAHLSILENLKESSIPVLSEEGAQIPYSERMNWEKLWIVDPLDGTKEFIKRNGEFTVNIALIKDQKPVLGVVYAPVLDTLYFGSEQGGAYKIVDAQKQTGVALYANAIRLPEDQGRASFTVVASKSHLSIETQEYINELACQHPHLELISIGSSLKLCLIAEGSADCYPRFAPTMEWDIAAGHAVCKAAGKDVYLVETKQSMTYNREELLNSWFIAE